LKVLRNNPGPEGIIDQFEICKIYLDVDDAVKLRELQTMVLYVVDHEQKCG